MLYVLIQTLFRLNRQAKNSYLWFKTQEDSVKKFNDPLDIAHFKAIKNVIFLCIPEQRWDNMEFDFKSDNLMGIFKDNKGIPYKLAHPIE